MLDEVCTQIENDMRANRYAIVFPWALDVDVRKLESWLTRNGYNYTYVEDHMEISHAQ